jgi:hypothetical protein
VRRLAVVFGLMAMGLRLRQERFVRVARRARGGAGCVGADGGEHAAAVPQTYPRASGWSVALADLPRTDVEEGGLALGGPKYAAYVVESDHPFTVALAG